MSGGPSELSDTLQGTSAEPSLAPPTLGALFAAFFKIGVLGFGGVAAFARHVLVEERRFLSAQGFAELFGIASTLPGANTVNLSIMLGDRSRGVLGALAAVGGLLGAPLVILMGVAALYARFGSLGIVKAGVAGAAAAAAEPRARHQLQARARPRTRRDDAGARRRHRPGLFDPQAADAPDPRRRDSRRAGARRRPRAWRVSGTSPIGQLFRTFGALSLMSIGGANATVPEIHRQIVDGLHLMNDATFAKLIAIGQTSPGPNVLVVSMIGWSLAGLAGLLVATVAFIGPSGTFALAMGRLMTRYEAVGLVARLRKALAPVAVGFMLASGVVMTQSAYAGLLSLVIAAAVAALVTLTRISPFWGIFAGALVGIAAYLVSS